MTTIRRILDWMASPESLWAFDMICIAWVAASILLVYRAFWGRAVAPEDFGPCAECGGRIEGGPFTAFAGAARGGGDV